MLDIKCMTVLVTGAAGFIGAHVARRLLALGSAVTGVDNLNTYYDPKLKLHRLTVVKQTAPDKWRFIHGDLTDQAVVEQVFTDTHPDVVVHLAAQAGVRFSVTNPGACVASNLLGFHHVLEACRQTHVKHLIYASSSSVYGDDTTPPFAEDAKADHPVSLYAATKRCDELLAHSYGTLYALPCTGLRFFTVYGPMGRPDMAYFKFTDKLRRGEDIDLYNHGHCQRDFTYIDDVVEGVVRVLCRPPALPTVYNLGCGEPVELTEFVSTLHQALINAEVLPADHDLAAHMHRVSMQPGDVQTTWADMSRFMTKFDFKPTTTLRAGLRTFAEWYANMYVKNTGP